LDLISGPPFPDRPLLLTFDDGYTDNLQFAQPILRRHGARATIFVVSGHLGGQPQWVSDGAKLMNPQQLRELDPEVFELALHSHSHRAFASMSLDGMCRPRRGPLRRSQSSGLAARRGSPRCIRPPRCRSPPHLDGVADGDGGSPQYSNHPASSRFLSSVKGE
jgi:peptidoglycan/xylan/chitin deacetylase (PgdA/CDA1 family)